MDMDLLNRSAAILLFALASQPVAASDSAPAQPSRVVLQGVTVVDVSDGSLAPDRSVVIEGGRIERIAAASAPLDVGGAQVVDARGRFLVPGYVDMHAHPLNAPDPTDNLRLMLAAGITGYRQMSGSPQQLQARGEGRLDHAEGPRLLALSGTILTDSLAPTPEAARAEVRRQQAQGADFIKSVGLSRAGFLASLDEARKIGIPYTGHIHSDVDVREATGMRSIEHLGALEAMLLSCSDDETAIRKAIAEMEPEPPQVGPGPADMAETLARFIANPLLPTPQAQFAIQRRVLDSYDEGRCRALAAKFVADGTWQVPTLLRLRTMAIPTDPAYRDDPNLRYVPPATRAMWTGLADQFATRIAPADQEMLERFFDLLLQVTQLLQEEGVPLLAGSDAGGSQWVIPGVSLHQEFDLLAEAGLTPLQVLQAGTLNAARFLGLEQILGTVEPGKDANLVLLEADPLADVANLHRIAGVVRAGAYHPQSALRDMKESACHACEPRGE
jgi:imidazolonepropionase-like amidohydrolase